MAIDRLADTGGVQSRASRLVTVSARVPLQAEENGERLMDAVGEVVRARQQPPLSIYVGVPYCAYKCHFCDWVADVPVHLLRSGPSRRAPYVNAICNQIRYYGGQLADMGYVPTYMYWGGGTPTRLSVPELLQIHQALWESFDLSTLKQWTVETTPNDLTREKLDALLMMGITRISVGVQSLNPEQLSRSGRGHTPQQAEAAISMMKASGLTSLNADVMTGFPNEDFEWIDRTLGRLVELGVPHLSVYPFRTSSRTVVERQVRSGQVAPLGVEQQLEAYARATTLLQAAGYEHGQHHSSWRVHEKHEDKDGNYKYSLMGDKVGFGSGAESIIGHRLVWNPSDQLERFIEDPLRFAFVRKFSLDYPEMFINCIGGTQMAFTDGLMFDRFETLTGVPFREFRNLPWTRQMFEYLEVCGATLLETEEAIRLDPSCIDRVVIAHQAHVTDRMRPGEAAAAL